MKQYIGISRDHSGSMKHISKPAMNDYNDLIETIKSASKEHDIDTIVSVVKCGIGPGAGRVEREVVNSTLLQLKPLDTYPANGGSTPLFNSVFDLIEIMKNVPDYDDLETSFLINVVTDGEENVNRSLGKPLGEEIKKLQATDRWTFVFRVPKGYARSLIELGIPEGNVLEWEQTKQGMERSSKLTGEAINKYYQGIKSGVKSTKSFYADLRDVSSADLKKELVKIDEKDFVIYDVNEEITISKFVEKKTKSPLVKGSAFYELMKAEKAVQDYKKICIRDNSTGNVYGGDAARQMLGLPSYGTVSLIPKKYEKYTIFVQSTSTTRKLKKGTKLLLWR